MYIPLKNKTSYSLLHSTIKIDDLINFACHNKIPAIAICDTNNMFGAFEFNEKCISNGIQPITGCEITFFMRDKNSFSLCLYAQNENGYENLLHLMKMFYIDKNKKIFIHESIKYFSNLLAVYCGEKCEYIHILHAIFTNRLYVGVDRSQKQCDSQIINTACKKNIPLLAINCAFFQNKNFFTAYKSIRCIDEGKILNTYEEHFAQNNYLRCKEEMLDLFKDIPAALENTITFAKRCSFILLPKKISLPLFSSNAKDIFDKEVNSKIKLFLSENTFLDAKQYVERIQYEKNIIKELQLENYFLIVKDFVQWCKKNNIPVGPGRGSAAGSLLSYILGITEIDPLKFTLFFDRFINKNRVTMADFDIDFCPLQRDKVVNYIVNKYGSSKVAQIIAIGKLQPRAVFRDVGRILKIPYSQIDEICKLLPYIFGQPLSIEEAFSKDAKLRKIINQSDSLKKCFEISKQLEGIYRNTTIHAAGIIISKDNLEKYVPLYKSEESTLPLSQYVVKHIEKAGVVKFDLLGLKTLTVIQRSLNLLKSRGVFLSLEKISLNNRKTFTLLKRGRCAGVFQLEGKGFTEACINMQVNTFQEIATLIALYRPGPMENIPLYIKNKNFPEKIEYLNDKVKNILKETFGLIVYQEQVLQIAKEIAGYTPLEADMLRYSIGKKDSEEMKKHERKFLENCCSIGGLSEKVSMHLFESIKKFSSYAFNKAHATSYALITYRTAYLKANYPLEFFTCLMNYENLDIERLGSFIKEAIKENVFVLKPHINFSTVNFSIHKEDNREVLRYGLRCIKNVSENSMEEVCKERDKNGAFTCIGNFVRRMGKNINKKQIEGLLKAGAFDALHDNRQEILNCIDKIILHEKNSRQKSLFSWMQYVKKTSSDNIYRRQKDEVEFTGISFSH